MRGSISIFYFLVTTAALIFPFFLIDSLIVEQSTKYQLLNRAQYYLLRLIKLQGINNSNKLNITPPPEDELVVGVGAGGATTET